MNSVSNYLQTELSQFTQKDDTLFDFLLRSCKDGLWIWDVENPENEWMNVTFWKTLGYTPEEVAHVKKAWTQFIFVEDLPLVRALVHGNFNTPNFEYVQEIRYRHKDGSILWLICKGRFIYNEAGKPIRMVGGHTDITKEKKLDYENTRLEAILSASSDLCFVLDTNYRFIEYHHNPNNAELIVSPDFFMGKTISEVGFPPNVYQIISEGVAQTLATGKKTSVEYDLDFPEREKQFYSLTISLFVYEKEIPAEILCFVQNITERKKADLALKESEERFRNAIQATQDGLWEWDMLTNKEFCSPRWCEIIGYKFDDPELAHNYNSWAERIHPDDAKRVENIINERLKTGKIYNVEYQHLHKSGEYRWQNYRGQVFFDETGKAYKMVGCIADISERKRAEALAQQINTLHQTLLDNVPGYVVCRDYDGHFLFVNKAFAALFGKKPEEVIGLTDAAYGATPEEINNYLTADRKVMDSGESLFVPEEPVLRKDGTRGIFQATKVPIDLMGLEKSAVLIVATDITELKQIESQLIESQRELLYKSQILSAIAKTTEKLLVSKNINETLQASFSLIGNATNIGRVYYFENDLQKHTVNYKIEWVSEDTISVMDNPQLHNISFEQLAEYMIPLFENKIFQNITRKIQNPVIQKRLKAQKTQSILLLPIFVKNTFHGFIGFDDCNSERIWSIDELNAFTSLATNIANAIERIHNEEAIKKSEGNFRQINETIEDVFWLYDIINRKYLYISPSCQHVIGISQENFYDGSYKTQNMVKVLEADRPVHDSAQELLFAQDSYEITYRINVGEQIKWINEKSYAIRDEQGTFIRQSGICTDITEKVEKQSQLEELLHVTNKQNKRLTDFAQIISHNIRSHSSNLSSLVDIIDVTEDEEEQSLYWDMTRKSIDKLAETIHNLNEIITIQNSKNIPKSTMYLHREIVSTIYALGAIIHQSQATILHEIDEKISIEAIPAYLESILLNLLTNAIKYRSPDRPLKIICSVQKKEGFMVLSIQDNGLGIDLKKNGHKLFGMYKTFHTHKDAKGIGLFITKSQVESMGGKIEVESQVGVGTTFSVYFLT